jgi:hypothetical protein
MVAWNAGHAFDGPGHQDCAQKYPDREPDEGNGESERKAQAHSFDEIRDLELAE